MNKDSENRFTSMIEKDSALKDLIGYLDKSFKVGDEIPSERDLEIDIGYSPAKLREALIRLECFGYIDIHHGKPNKLLKPFEIKKE
ncbi:GntR family transcriptional regulator [uncultured Paraglaciecola sp.]|uniref:GntR family transcriptional regulator n=1 Tax=uncultured Paraglaciecola sp. TaxID=1765024 RepID=UPI002598F958|nr:GntR family transcriptional regulator [uncultured Paraglaciecola sp.]